MSKPWSKLQKEFYLLRADSLDLQLHCRAYRMNSQKGATNCPRYWITFEKEVIWDYPKDFVGTNDPNRADLKWYPHGTDIPDISNLIREYIDTPKKEIMGKNFENDHWGLIDILRAADKRIGTRRLPEFKQIVGSVACRVVDARLGEK